MRGANDIAKGISLDAQDAGRKYINVASRLAGRQMTSHKPQSQSRTFKIVNKRGLHARASARFVQTVEGYRRDRSGDP
jgi:hypothetical protein